MSQVDVVTLGECMVALRCSGMLRLGAPMTTSIAGAESNVAIGLARLGHRSRWVGRVGSDESGELVMRTLRAEGVDLTGVITDPERETGLIVFEQRLPDVTRVEYHRRGSAGSRLCADDVTTLQNGSPRLLHVSGVTAALSSEALGAIHAAIDIARAAGAAICVDINYRARLWDRDRAAKAMRPLVDRADIVVGSQDEFELLTGAPADLLAGEPREVIVKRGAEGATGYSRDADPVTVPAYAVPVLDSIGAGDAFCAGFISGWLDELELRQRLERANAVGAFAVASSGDWEGLPTRAELELVKTQPGQAVR